MINDKERIAQLESALRLCRNALDTVASCAVGSNAKLMQTRADDAIKAADAALGPLTRYRLSRPDAYGPATPGHKNPGARSGHYVDARSPSDARAVIRKRLDLDLVELLDVQDWTDGPNQGRLVDDAGAYMSRAFFG